MERVLEEGTSWAFADQGSFKMSLRKVKANIKEANNQAKEHRRL